ncbi:MFS transporter [Aquirhabdus parva]|uniref:MFS transporter n=1 Tax=Aquirhabdus parva TaxID=2283318 RepID=A0A345PA22_9GAMM|nr:MFS transporter [Aquirhabdus parva]AXI04131.1 MFS transporter [Aquirhabdus parva]
MKNNKLWLVIAMTVLNSMGLTIVMPLFPFLLGQYLTNNQVVIGLSILLSVFSVCQFLSSPVLGAISDRFGRRPILVISILGSAIGYAVMGVGGALWVLFLGRIIDGLTAGNMSTLFAYIADSTAAHERTKWFGYMGAAIGIGFITGPAIGGLLGSASLQLPFYIAAGISLFAAIATQLVLPESLPLEKRSSHFSWQHLNTFAHFKDVLSLGAARPFILMGLLFGSAMFLYQSNITVFLKDIYLLGPAGIGVILTLIGVCDILSRAILLPRLIKIWTEVIVGRIGLTLTIVGFGLVALCAFETYLPLVYGAVVCITIGEGLFEPTLNSMLSTAVSEDQQGKLQGANQSFLSLSRAITPLIAGGIYVYSQSAVYALSAFLMACALILFSRLATVRVYS